MDTTNYDNDGDTVMTIGVCDDDGFVFGRVESVLQEYFGRIGEGYEFHAFRTAEELLCFCMDGDSRMDLLFMDIEMPDMDGMELSRRVHEYKPQCQIAYHTNYLEYVSDVYETEHCYYVLKEEFAGRLPDIINKVKGKMEWDKEIFLDIHGRMECISTGQILYMERDIKKTYIHMEGGGVVETRHKLAELLALLGPAGFVRCHASFIVPFPKVKKYTRTELVLKNGVSIPISRSYAGNVKEAFGKWSGTQI